MGREGEKAIFSRGRTYYVEGVGILFDHGTTVPADGTADYAPGAIFQHVDGTSGLTLYVNEGTLSSCDFNAATSAAAAALETALALATTPGGASKVGVFDTAGWWTATTVEALLAELGAFMKGNSTAADDSGPSPLLWSGAPVLEVMLNPGKGFHFFEDFLQFDPVTAQGILITQTSANGTVANDPTLKGGVIDIDTEAGTDTDGPTVQWPGLQVTPAPGLHIYLEFRLKISDDQGNVCIGLGCDSVTVFHDGAAVITNKDHALFFRDDGVTDADLGAQACDGTNTASEDDVCDDVDKAAYENFGIHIFGDGDTAGDYVKFYHKGVLVKEIIDADGGGDDGVPDGIMCPVIQVNVDDNTTQTHIYLDWMKMLVYHATSGTARE